MKKIELAKASAPLSEYARKAKKDPIVVVKRGKPVAAVVPIRNADAETVSLSTNRQFLAIIERPRQAQKGRGNFFQRNPSAVRVQKIVFLTSRPPEDSDSGIKLACLPEFVSPEDAGHFDISRILETWKYRNSARPSKIDRLSKVNPSSEVKQNPSLISLLR